MGSASKHPTVAHPQLTIDETLQDVDKKPGMQRMMERRSNKNDKPYAQAPRGADTLAPREYPTQEEQRRTPADKGGHEEHLGN